MTKIILRTRDLWVQYGKKRAVKGISLELREGETVLIAGRNGAGKSTLLKTLGGLIFPDRGAVDRLGMSQKEIGIITDRMSLFRELTLEEGIAFHRKVFDVKEFDGSILEQLGVDTGDRISSLSSGERALFHLSLLISQRPRLLLVDEVFHLADPYIRDVFIDTLIGLIESAGTTLVMVNHTFSETGKIPDRVLIMDEGEILIDEPRETLLENVRRVSSEMPDPPDLPVFFSRNTPFGSEFFVYPFQPGTGLPPKYHVENADLGEIIKAFLGGRYAKKRM